MNDKPYYLKQALIEAQKRKGFCAPNPAVGAVVVHNDQMISHGTHWAPGFAHAEVNALESLSNEITEKATLFVTLEPCCHHGRTPPCTELIIRRGIKTVYFSQLDPNPKVAGQGQKILQAAGVTCEHLPLSEISEFYRSYCYWHQYQRPWVNAKLAQSADDKIAEPDGKPVAITGEKAQQYTHQWRKQCDAILTTANTILHDNPRLNVRLEKKAITKPIYVLDSQLRTTLNSQIFTTAKSLTFFYDSTLDPLKLVPFQSASVRCVPIEKNQQGLNLTQVLEQIGKDGVHELWVEAGAHCFSALITQGLVQRGILYRSTRVLGKQATPGLALNKPPLSNWELKWFPIGEDFCAIF